MGNLVGELGRWGLPLAQDLALFTTEEGERSQTSYAVEEDGGRTRRRGLQLSPNPVHCSSRASDWTGMPVEEN